MKQILRNKTPKRNAQASAAPYSKKNLLDQESKQKFEDEFLKCISGKSSGFYFSQN